LWSVFLSLPRYYPSLIIEDNPAASVIAGYAHDSLTMELQVAYNPVYRSGGLPSRGSFNIRIQTGAQVFWETERRRCR
ncbi:hypothetical protein ACFLV5_03440, partial [Chloroflexota bacterium]